MTSDTHRRVAGLAREDAAGLLFGHVEVFQVGIVDVFGEGLQISHLWVVLTSLACRQPCHQLPLLGFWHPAKADGCTGMGVQSSRSPCRGQNLLIPLQVHGPRMETYVFGSGPSEALEAASWIVREPLQNVSSRGTGILCLAHRSQHTQALTHRVTKPLWLRGGVARLGGGQSLVLKACV